jgi:dihydroorotate dehydrogenase
MGFNSIGAEAFVRNLRKQGRPGIIGINIGKGKDTANEQTIEDYLKTFTAVYAYADYVAINISSPNTPGLRDLQDRQKLDELLGRLKHEQVALGKTRRVYVPIAIKISPDLDDDRITAIAQLALTHRLDAIIATNTTISRPGVEGHPCACEHGGLSGRPLKDLSTAAIKKLYSQLQGRVPIIGLGGVENAEDAWEKLVAGADLIQIYTALIYQGPRVVQDIVSGLARRVETSGCATLAETVAKARSGIRLMR